MVLALLVARMANEHSLILVLTPQPVTGHTHSLVQHSSGFFVRFPWNIQSGHTMDANNQAECPDCNTLIKLGSVGLANLACHRGTEKCKEINTHIDVSTTSNASGLNILPIAGLVKHVRWTTGWNIGDCRAGASFGRWCSGFRCRLVPYLVISSHAG